MGRWLEKINRVTKTQSTKPAALNSVSFVGAPLNHLHTIKLQNEFKMKFLSRCCKGLGVTPQDVLDSLLSVEDEHDIINGDLPAGALKLGIKLWLEAGKPHQSGKPI